MILFLRRNKILSILIVLTIGFFILGCFLPALISNNDKKIVSDNIKIMYDGIKNYNYSSINIVSTYVQELSIIGIIWILGISIIGFFFILILYLFKVFMIGAEVSFLILNINRLSMLFIILYLLPKFILNIVLSFLSFYALEYSLVLIRLLFFKLDIPIKKVTMSYLKILLYSLVIEILIISFQVFILPKLFNFF